MCLLAMLEATKSFKTISSLNLGLKPHAVENLRHLILKLVER